jgi:hypothetical protein
MYKFFIKLAVFENAVNFGVSCKVGLLDTNYGDKLTNMIPCIHLLCAKNTLCYITSLHASIPIFAGVPTRVAEGMFFPMFQRV